MADNDRWPTHTHDDALSCVQGALAALDQVAEAETRAWQQAAADLASGHRLTVGVGVGWISADDVETHWDQRTTELIAAGIHRDLAYDHLVEAVGFLQT